MRGMVSSFFVFQPTDTETDKQQDAHHASRSAGAERKKGSQSATIMMMETGYETIAYETTILIICYLTLSLSITFAYLVNVWSDSYCLSVSSITAIS